MNAAASLALIALISFSGTGAHQEQGGHESDRSGNLEVRGVGQLPGVSIQVKIANDGSSRIVMPSCGRRLQRYFVCFPPAFLEQFDGAAWQRVEFTNDHMFGEWAKPSFTIIEPYQSLEVDEGLPPELFKLKPDQPVRLVIPMWPAADKSRAPKNVIRYTTGPLQPPNFSPLAFRSEPLHNMEVTKVSRAPVVSMDLEIENKLGFEVSFLSCGENYFEKHPIVCFPPAFFEQYDGSAWQRVESTSATDPSGKADYKFSTIEPHDSMEVDIGFSPEVYKWKSGQPVRLVMLAWPGFDKVRDPKNAIRYFTSPLQPPSVGHLAFLPQ